jgi:hypothetical protein
MAPLQFFYLYTRNLLKIPDIGRGNGIIQGNGCRRNDKIVGADGKSFLDESGPDTGTNATYRVTACRAGSTMPNRPAASESEEFLYRNGRPSLQKSRIRL